MIQVLAARRSQSFRDEDALTPRRCGAVAEKVIDLEDSDRQLLEYVRQRDSSDVHLQVPIEDLEMLMTKMNEDQVPDKPEVHAVFSLADVEQPQHMLNICELESAMRYWRLLIPERQRIKEVFAETKFGTTETERKVNLSSVLQSLHSSVIDGDIRDVLSMLKVHEDGTVDRDSALSAVMMQVLVRILNRGYQSYEGQQDLNINPENTTSNDLLENVPSIQAPENTVVKSSTCCSLS